MIGMIVLLLSPLFILWLTAPRTPKEPYYQIIEHGDGSRTFIGNVPQEILDTARPGDRWDW